MDRSKLSTVTVDLNPIRREELYLKCQEAMNEHHEGEPDDQTPALVYEAMDVLALMTANIYANLNKVDKTAAKNMREYFRKQFKFYTEQLQNVKPKPELILPNRRH